MDRIVGFWRETLDMILVYLALVCIAIPFVVLSWNVFATGEFLLAVVLLGISLALFLMPVFEKRFRIFAKRNTPTLRTPPISLPSVSRIDGNVRHIG